MTETVTLPRDVVQQALKALENTSPLGFNMESDKKFYAAITALRAALEQPQNEQEPDWSNSKTLPSELWKSPLLSLQERLQIADGAVRWHRDVIDNLRSRLQQQSEQEPEPALAGAIRAEPTELIHKWRVLELIKDHTNPQPPRHPLTDEEINAIWKSCATLEDKGKRFEFAKRIMAAYGIKEQK